VFFAEIERLIKTGLLRAIKDREPHVKPFRSYQNDKSIYQPDFQPYGSSHILISAVEYINFSSNDYLGLSSNRLIMESAKAAIDAYGFGSGASRLLSGGTDLNMKLEQMIAEFKGTESALIFNSGYTANTSVIPAIAGEGDVIFSDELNHASIIDGCRLSRAKKLIYRHTDMEHLALLLKKEKRGGKVVISDTVFSMDGDIAPLGELFNICKENDAILYIDDAHGTGVLGQGQGALNHFGIKPEPWIIQMGTFSKALGSYGAFIAANSETTQWLINKARGLIFSTALPACVAAASIKAIEIVRDEPTLLQSLWENRQTLFKGIRELGYDTMNSQTPIIPLITPMLQGKDIIESTNIFSNILMENHIYAPAIRPPTVTIPRIRFSVIASHTKEDIETLLSCLRDIKNQ
jgi:8-amino-7-oxononanoate synthase